MNAAPTRPESNGATERSPRETHATRPNPSTELAISRFEQVSAWLLAIALFLGILVGMLAIIWLTRWPDSQSTPPPPEPPTIDLRASAIDPAGSIGLP